MWQFARPNRMYRDVNGSMPELLAAEGFWLGGTSTIVPVLRLWGSQCANTVQAPPLDLQRITSNVLNAVLLKWNGTVAMGAAIVQAPEPASQHSALQQAEALCPHVLVSVAVAGVRRADSLYPEPVQVDDQWLHGSETETMTAVLIGLELEGRPSAAQHHAQGRVPLPASDRPAASGRVRLPVCAGLLLSLSLRLQQQHPPVLAERHHRPSADAQQRRAAHRRLPAVRPGHAGRAQAGGGGSGGELQRLPAAVTAAAPADDAAAGHPQPSRQRQHGRAWLVGGRHRLRPAGRGAGGAAQRAVGEPRAAPTVPAAGHEPLQASGCRLPRCRSADALCSPTAIQRARMAYGAAATPIARTPGLRPTASTPAWQTGRAGRPANC